MENLEMNFALRAAISQELVKHVIVGQLLFLLRG